jgi:hypothetical protein
MESVSHNGSFSTKTDFRLVDGSQVRLEVWLQTELTSANVATYCVCNLSTKGKGCVNWNFQFKSARSLDDRILKVLTHQQLYSAYSNHWVKLNPIRLFCNSSVNGEYVEFSVTENPHQLKHFAF